MKEIHHIVITLFALVFYFNNLQAQHLFSVHYNNLSNEKIIQMIEQSASADIPVLSLAKNNENKNIYPVALSSCSSIIILNEQTGSHVTITPSESSLAEFQFEPFLIEEMKQAVLGDANSYLIVNTDNDFFAKKFASIPIPNNVVYLPQYFYGKQENVKEALPSDRQIINIFKEKPIYLPAFPDDLENLQYIAQLEEEMSYYVYMYQLPDGIFCIYDKHFNPDNEEISSFVGYNLQFALTGTMTSEQREATEYALELWGEQLAGRTTVDINVTFKPLASGVLGSSYKMQHFLDDSGTYGLSNTWYFSSLWNQLVGYDATSLRDIKIEMNSDFNFYYGVDGNTTSGTHDYLTIMLHEITHGLGFSSLLNQNGGFYYTNASGSNNNFTSYPSIFDRQLFQGLDGTCISNLTQSERATVIASNNLYSGAPGSHLLYANEGIRVKMYAPTTYSGGSSVSHWDNSVAFPTFMKYSIGSGAGNALHSFNDRKVGILLDLGWATPIPDPNAFLVTFMANGGEGDMKPQQFFPGVTKKLKANSFTRRGYSFKNWNTLSNGTGVNYEARESIILSSNMTLYTQWNAKTYTLYFNANQGTVGIYSKPVVYDELIGELPVPVRNGYKFLGWTINTDTIKENTIWNYAENKQARAAWKQNTGIEENPFDELLQIIPNPASHTIEVRITNYGFLNEADVELFDAMGRMQMTERRKQKAENAIEIDISHLQAGIYFVQLKTDNGMITRKFVKQ